MGGGGDDDNGPGGWLQQEAEGLQEDPRQKQSTLPDVSQVE